MERKNYTVAIDLGSSNVVVAVAERQPDGKTRVASIVSKPVEGVRAGMIENIELVSRAISEAVTETEDTLGIRIAEAYAGLSGDFLRCARHTDHIFVYDPQNGVNQKDVEALFDRMRNVQAPDDETIMDRIPQSYLIDEGHEVLNPVGSFGKKLSAVFNFILCNKTPVQRLDMALKRLGIKMLCAIPNPLVIPEALLSSDEREEGVAVVDLGGNVTDVTVYYGDTVRYIASIPMGGSAINRDIRTMSVPEKHIENLKQKYGSAVADLAPEDKLIRVNGRTARDAKDILLRNLAIAIEARCTDIVEFVQQELRDSGYADRLSFGIVLTGGGAHLKHIDELFRRLTGLEVRIAHPEIRLTEDSLERTGDPACATAVGILLHCAELPPCAVIDAEPRPAAPATPAAAPAPAPQPAPPQPRQPLQQPTPRPMPQFRHIPPQPQPQPARPMPAQPVQQPVQQPIQQPVQPVQPQPLQPEPEAPQYREPTTAPAAESAAEPRRKGFGAKIKAAISVLNETFNSADDEEI